MPAILEATIDARGKTFCFATVADAERFREFGVTYVNDSGAGNGYGGVWIYRNEEIIEVAKAHKSWDAKFDSHDVQTIWNSLVSITRERHLDVGDLTKVGNEDSDVSLVNETGTVARLQIGHTPEGITFNCTLPPRLPAVVGGMFRARPEHRRDFDRKNLPREGVVLREDPNKGMLVATSWAFDSGRFAPKHPGNASAGGWVNPETIFRTRNWLGQRYGKNGQLDIDDDVVDQYLRDRVLPIGTRVLTVQRDPAATDWSTEALLSRRWDVEGKVVAVHNAHGLSYEVQHFDDAGPAIGHYEHHELMVQK